MNEIWNYNDPPLTEDRVGPKSLVTYEVKYRNGTIGKSCWWYDGWYCDAKFQDIIAYREVKK